METTASVSRTAPVEARIKLTLVLSEDSVQYLERALMESNPVDGIDNPWHAIFDALDKAGVDLTRPKAELIA
jgi:hypothetical protein